MRAGRFRPAVKRQLHDGCRFAFAANVELDNLAEPEASDYLERRGVPTEQRDAVLHFTRGYPLALSLAAGLVGLLVPGLSEKRRDDAAPPGDR